MAPTAAAGAAVFPQPGALPGAASPGLGMPKLQNQQPQPNSAAGAQGTLRIQSKHTNTSLCQGAQIPETRRV